MVSGSMLAWTRWRRNAGVNCDSIKFARSGMAEVRSTAAKDRNPAAGYNVPDQFLVQQTACFDEQRGRGLIECLEFVAHGSTV